MVAAVRRWRRRAVLVTLGGGWTGYGAIGVLGDPRYGTSRGLDVITDWAPMSVLGWVWVACGLAAVVAGLAPRVGGVQSAGFTALATPAALWGTAFLIATLSGSYPRGGGGACGWLAFAVSIVWVSGMDDPPAVPREKVRQ
ncbi:hypothetical protein ABT275_03475 [Streptomyces sp. NPDC001185]|uniref:hypothetical protein n=1 Tax=Streptomyces sp. NPDC001185 TaxID=3154380 RepID=UPI00332871DB